MNLPSTTRRRKRDMRVRRIVRALRRASGRLDSPLYAPLLRSFAESVVVGEQLYSAITSGGVLRDDDSVRPVVEAWRRIVGEQNRLASALGLSPVAARLAVSDPNSRDDALATLANSNVEDGEIVPANDTAAPVTEPEPVLTPRRSPGEPEIA